MMNKSTMKSDPVLSLVNNSLVIFPIPININIWWNFGSILGLNLMIQIISGLLLSMHYCPNTNMAFYSVIHIIQDIENGWLLRNIHMNGASFYFLFMYIHMARGIYYYSFKLTRTWTVGVIMYLLSMMTAFVGYILPWGQMSLWGATVITNLLSTVPYMGLMLVNWLWGGFSVDNPTLNRFYSFHFILPFIIMFMVGVHLYFLHLTGSNNPLGSWSDLSKISFHIYFTMKDLIGFLMFMFVLLMVCLSKPYMFLDPENFIEANPMVTPKHIQPEWYFLFAYAILRTIPSKFGGVMGLIMSIMILWMFPMYNNSKFKGFMFYPVSQYFYWMFISSFLMLTWSGGKPIEYPYFQISVMYSIMYFMFFILFNEMMKMWDKIIYMVDQIDPILFWVKT
uniref:Cytochrome b n=1 Tax=Dielis tejensis TaxID=2928478 RepID=A0A9Y1G0B8_9HYME|nr:cytochrome b [Dielis tejensis]